MEQVRELDLSVDCANPAEGLNHLVRIIRPEWNTDKLAMKDMSTGYMNRNFKVYTEDDPQDPLFVRLVNPQFAATFMDTYKRASLFIDQENLGPKLHCCLQNGFCQQFLSEYRSLSWETRSDMYRDEIWPLTADKLAQYHSKHRYERALKADVPNETNELPPSVPAVLNMAKMKDPESEFCKRIPGGDEFVKARQWFIRTMEKIYPDKAFCHSDGNPTNWLVKDDDAVLVDYDVTGINYPSTDIGWFFLTHCDFRKMDLSEYPSVEYQRKWLRRYLTTKRRNDEADDEVNAQVTDQATEAVSDADIEAVLEEIRVGILGAYLQATMAGMIVTVLSQKPGPEEIKPQTTLVVWEEFKRRQRELISQGYE